MLLPFLLLLPLCLATVNVQWNSPILTIQGDGIANVSIAWSSSTIMTFDGTLNVISLPPCVGQSGNTLNVNNGANIETIQFTELFDKVSLIGDFPVSQVTSFVFGNATLHSISSTVLQGRLQIISIGDIEVTGSISTVGDLDFTAQNIILTVPATLVATSDVWMRGITTFPLPMTNQWVTIHSNSSTHSLYMESITGPGNLVLKGYDKMFLNNVIGQPYSLKSLTIQMDGPMNNYDDGVYQLNYVTWYAESMSLNTRRLLLQGSIQATNMSGTVETIQAGAQTYFYGALPAFGTNSPVWYLQNGTYTAPGQFGNSATINLFPISMTSNASGYTKVNMPSGCVFGLNNVIVTQSHGTLMNSLTVGTTDFNTATFAIQVVDPIQPINYTVASGSISNFNQHYVYATTRYSIGYQGGDIVIDGTLIPNSIITVETSGNDVTITGNDANLDLVLTSVGNVWIFTSPLTETGTFTNNSDLPSWVTLTPSQLNLTLTNSAVTIQGTTKSVTVYSDNPFVGADSLLMRASGKFIIAKDSIFYTDLTVGSIQIQANLNITNLNADLIQCTGHIANVNATTILASNVTAMENCLGYPLSLAATNLQITSSQGLTQGGTTLRLISTFSISIGNISNWWSVQVIATPPNGTIVTLPAIDAVDSVIINIPLVIFAYPINAAAKSFAVKEFSIQSVSLANIIPGLLWNGDFTRTFWVQHGVTYQGDADFNARVEVLRCGYFNVSNTVCNVNFAGQIVLNSVGTVYSQFFGNVADSFTATNWYFQGDAKGVDVGGVTAQSYNLFNGPNSGSFSGTLYSLGSNLYPANYNTATGMSITTAPWSLPIYVRWNGSELSLEMHGNSQLTLSGGFDGSWVLGTVSDRTGNFNTSLSPLPIPSWVTVSTTGLTIFNNTELQVLYMYGSSPWMSMGGTFGNFVPVFKVNLDTGFYLIGGDFFAPGTVLDWNVTSPSFFANVTVKEAYIQGNFFLYNAPDYSQFNATNIVFDIVMALGTSMANQTLKFNADSIIFKKNFNGQNSASTNLVLNARLIQVDNVGDGVRFKTIVFNSDLTQFNVNSGVTVNSIGFLDSCTINSFGLNVKGRWSKPCNGSVSYLQITNALSYWPNVEGLIKDTTNLTLVIGNGVYSGSPLDFTGKTVNLYLGSLPALPTATSVRFDQGVIMHENVTIHINAYPSLGTSDVLSWPRLSPLKNATLKMTSTGTVTSSQSYYPLLGPMNGTLSNGVFLVINSVTLPIKYNSGYVQIGADAVPGPNNFQMIDGQMVVKTVQGGIFSIEAGVLAFTVSEAFPIDNCTAPIMLVGLGYCSPDRKTVHFMAFGQNDIPFLLTDQGTTSSQTIVITSTYSQYGDMAFGNMTWNLGLFTKVLFAPSENQEGIFWSYPLNIVGSGGVLVNCSSLQLEFNFTVHVDLSSITNQALDAIYFLNTVIYPNALKLFGKSSNPTGILSSYQARGVVFDASFILPSSNPPTIEIQGQGGLASSSVSSDSWHGIAFLDSYIFTPGKVLLQGLAGGLTGQGVNVNTAGIYLNHSAILIQRGIFGENLEMIAGSITVDGSVKPGVVGNNYHGVYISESLMFFSGINDTFTTSSFTGVSGPGQDSNGIMYVKSSMNDDQPFSLCGGNTTVTMQGTSLEGMGLVFQDAFTGLYNGTDFILDELALVLIGNGPRGDVVLTGSSVVTNTLTIQGSVCNAIGSFYMPQWNISRGYTMGGLNTNLTCNFNLPGNVSLKGLIFVEKGLTSDNLIVDSILFDALVKTDYIKAETLIFNYGSLKASFIDSYLALCQSDCNFNGENVKIVQFVGNPGTRASVNASVIDLGTVDFDEFITVVNFTATTSITVGNVLVRNGIVGFDSPLVKFTGSISGTLNGNVETVISSSSNPQSASNVVGYNGTFIWLSGTYFDDVNFTGKTINVQLHQGLTSSSVIVNGNVIFGPLNTVIFGLADCNNGDRLNANVTLGNAKVKFVALNGVDASEEWLLINGHVNGTFASGVYPLDAWNVAIQYLPSNVKATLYTPTSTTSTTTTQTSSHTSVTTSSVTTSSVTTSSVTTSVGTKSSTLKSTTTTTTTTKTDNFLPSLNAVLTLGAPQNILITASTTSIPATSIANAVSSSPTRLPSSIYTPLATPVILNVAVNAKVAMAGLQISSASIVKVNNPKQVLIENGLWKKPLATFVHAGSFMSLNGNGTKGNVWFWFDAATLGQSVYSGELELKYFVNPSSHKRAGKGYFVKQLVKFTFGKTVTTTRFTTTMVTTTKTLTTTKLPYHIAATCRPGGSYKNPKNCCCAPPRQKTITLMVGSKVTYRPVSLDSRDEVQERNVYAQHLCSQCSSLKTLNKDTWCCPKRQTFTKTIYRTKK